MTKQITNLSERLGDLVERRTRLELELVACGDKELKRTFKREERFLARESQRVAAKLRDQALDDAAVAELIQVVREATLRVVVQEKTPKKSAK